VVPIVTVAAVPALPGTPAGPCGPVGPIGPWIPCGPWIPVKPLGIPKLKTAFCKVPVFVTYAGSPASRVVVLPTVTVALH